MPTPSSHTGCIYLVGAGPGDPRYITLRGVECLQRADAILYDYLVNPALLAHASPQAELVCLGQHGRTRVWSQAEINAEMIARAQQGQRVVRLKSGDPTMFARLAEELEAILAANLPFEIVPGITAALAAGSCAGIPLTHREHASAVALITGHEDESKSGTVLDYASLAQFPGTLVFYMGVTTIHHWTTALIAAGKSPQTPVAVVRRCSFPDQRTLRCTLGEVAERITLPEKWRPPMIVIVGSVTELAERYAWFNQRSLFGQRVLITRASHQADDLAQPLLERGADVLYQPAICIEPPRDFTELDQVLNQLQKYDWLVFSSANGVRYFLERLFAIGKDLRALASIKIAAIGPGTAASLREYHLHADLVPESDFRAETLAEQLSQMAPQARFLLVRANRGREVLAERLLAAGGSVQQVVAYQSVDVTTPVPAILEQLTDGRLDWVTVTSSAIARSLVAMFGNALRSTQLASISPITSQTLRELGFEPTVEATEYTMEGLVQAIERYSNDPV